MSDFAEASALDEAVATKLNEYITQKKSVRTLADELGVSIRKARSLLKQFLGSNLRTTISDEELDEALFQYVSPSMSIDGKFHAGYRYSLSLFDLCFLLSKFLVSFYLFSCSFTHSHI